jgi:hypothetical protein
MDYEPRQIEVIFGPNGRPRLSERGFPRVALVCPDIPAKFHDLAKYMDAGHTIMRATVGDMWAVYRLKGVTFAGDQMWTLLATVQRPGRDVHMVGRWAVGPEERLQIEGWLLDG